MNLHQTKRKFAKAPMEIAVQYIDSQFSLKVLQHSLKHAIYQPIDSARIDIVYISPCPAVQIQKSNKAIRLLKNLSKWLMVFGLLLPLKTSPPPTLTTFEKIQSTGVLTIATTDSIDPASPVPNLAYDTARRYAKQLKVRLISKNYPNAFAAKQALAQGQVDMIINSPVDPFDNNTKSKKSSKQRFDRQWFDSVAILPVGCHYRFNHLGQNGSQFVINKNSTQLIDDTKAYLCEPNNISTTYAMAKFYQTNLLNGYSQLHFERVIKHQLPLYEAHFRYFAQKYEHDWRLLVAVAYQESHLNPNAVSPTGVQGIMMLTQDTAAEMGVDDRTDIADSISGGAKYLHLLNDKFSDIPSSDRLWFVLAAYNMGPNAVRGIQDTLKEQEQDPTLWYNFYRYLMDNAEQNPRYRQCIHYVTNIRAFLNELTSNDTQKSNA